MKRTKILGFSVLGRLNEACRLPTYAEPPIHTVHPVSLLSWGKKKLVLGITGITSPSIPFFSLKPVQELKVNRTDVLLSSRKCFSPPVLPPDKSRILQKPPWARCYSHVLVGGQATQEILALKLQARALHGSEEMEHLHYQSLPEQLAYSSRGRRTRGMKGRSWRQELRPVCYGKSLATNEHRNRIQKQNTPL